ncbi:MAG: hypothetical protein H0V70_13345 [Ktedonobacteraceae bacterium]|nr:hypothetical protein [Ktedonobacteraceae bacterium]
MDQNEYPTTVPQQPCPVCGVSSSERGWQQFLGKNQSYTKILSKKHHMQGSVVHPLVCYQCGFVQLFVNPQDFEKEASV